MELKCLKAVIELKWPDTAVVHFDAERQPPMQVDCCDKASCECVCDSARCKQCSHCKAFAGCDLCCLHPNSFDAAKSGSADPTSDPVLLLNISEAHRVAAQ